MNKRQIKRLYRQLQTAKRIELDCHNEKIAAMNAHDKATELVAECENRLLRGIEEFGQTVIDGKVHRSINGELQIEDVKVL